LGGFQLKDKRHRRRMSGSMIEVARCIATSQDILKKSVRVLDRLGETTQSPRSSIRR